MSIHRIGAHGVVNFRIDCKQELDSVMPHRAFDLRQYYLDGYGVARGLFSHEEASGPCGEVVSTNGTPVVEILGRNPRPDDYQ